MEFLVNRRNLKLWVQKCFFKDGNEREEKGFKKKENLVQQIVSIFLLLIFGVNNQLDFQGKEEGYVSVGNFYQYYGNFFYWGVGVGLLVYESWWLNF